MKRIILQLVCGIVLLSQYVFSQSSSAFNSYVQGRYLGFDGSSGINPLLFKTNNNNRMKINGSYGTTQYTVDGYVNNVLGIDRSGYVLIGNNSPMMTQPGQTIYEDKGAFSLLHLNGKSPIQQNGYRPCTDEVFVTT